MKKIIFAVMLSMLCLGSVAQRTITGRDINEAVRISKPVVVDTARFEARYIYSRRTPQGTPGAGEYPFVLQIGDKQLKWKNRWDYKVDSVYNSIEGNTMRAGDHDTITNGLAREIMEVEIRYSTPDYVVCEESYIGCFRNIIHIDPFPQIDWALKDETKTLKGFECRKAETTFGGQHWTVWYTEEYPVAYGPWKLHGLPGLVVDAATDEDVHVFELQLIGKPGNPILKSGEERDAKFLRADELRKFKDLYKKNMKSAAIFLGSDVSYLPDEAISRPGYSNFIEK